jgi:hypothetical protein
MGRKRKMKIRIKRQNLTRKRKGKLDTNTINFLYERQKNQAILAIEMKCRFLLFVLLKNVRRKSIFGAD